MKTLLVGGLIVLLVGGMVVGATGFTNLGLGSAAESEATGDLGFRDVTAESGLDYEDEASGIGNGNAGVFVADVNNDGWQDVLALGADRPALFENVGGEFEESDRLPELSHPFRSALFFDYDGDGWTDLLLLPENASAVVLHNDGGTFEHVDLGIGHLTFPQGATAADYDGDGDLDLFIYQSGNWESGKPAGYFSTSGHVDVDNGNRNLLLENKAADTGTNSSKSDSASRRFERVEDAGIEGRTWSLAASFVDLTGDGQPDIHVANDYNNDTVYINEGDGTFERQLLGGATARNGMASEIADVTGDGRPDVFVSNIYLPISRENMSDERFERYERLFQFVIHSSRTKGNTLLVNEGDGRFSDAADRFGVRQGGWGWAASLSDFDNDGDRDIWQATQRVVRIDPDEPHYTYAMLWERDGDSFKSLDASERGIAERNERGMATLDFDRDGDLDVIAATYDGPVTVYENTLSHGNSVRFRVVDENGATALGAVVTVETDDDSATVRQSANVDYLSQESRVEHVGVGTDTKAMITVRWPDGTTRTFEHVPVNTQLTVTKRGVESVGNATASD